MTKRRRRLAGCASRAASIALIVASATLPGTTIARSAVPDGLPPAGPGTDWEAGRWPAVDASGPGSGTPAPAESPGLPALSIHYQDALAHASDVIDFEPGEVVTVGFTPRSGDAWPVAGAAPKALPAGRVSGKALHEAEQGSVWTGTPAQRRATEAGPGSPSGKAPADGPIGPTISGSNTGFVGGAGVTPLGANPGAAVSTNGLRREVFGFLPYWELTDSSTTYDWSVLSTIAYFSVGADKDGNLLKQNSDGSVTTGWSGWTSSKLSSVITAAHQNGARVVLTVSVFAWTTGQQATQGTLLGSATARANLARQVAAAVAERGADGVNLDFEPIVSGYADEFTALVRSVRAELDAIAPGYQLTFDTTGWIGNYPLEAATAPGGADAIFIMGYDYRGSSAAQVGSISPLSGPVYDLTDTVSAYTARVSPSKLILGVPYYGRAWSTDSDALHANNISGTQYGSSVTAVYGAAADLATQYGRRYDTIEQAPWTVYQKQTCTTTYGCVTSWRQLYFDDAESLKLRYDLINRTGLRGAGIWALGYDGTRPELYRALADKFLRDTTAPTAGIITLPATQRSAGFEVRWAGRDESSIASFDVQVASDGGAWADWKVATTATSAVFLADDGHAYAFRVRARDSHGNLADWTVTSTSTQPSLAVGGFGTVLVNNLNLRASAGTSAAAVGTVSSGDIVALTGGPVSADGYTWYEVTAPIGQWSPVDSVETGAWIAIGNSTSTYVAPRAPVNATAIAAVMRDFRVSNASGARFVAPNDPIRRAVSATWTNSAPLSELQARVFKADGTLLETRSIDRLAVGPQSIDFDGRVGGIALPAGTYLIQLTGRSNGAAVYAPAAVAVTPELVAAFGVTVDPSAGTTYVALSPTRLLDTR
ncbi:MAG: glycosyl hydrolase family 18 protein, partial [Chloroflexota bacterium]